MRNYERLLHRLLEAKSQQQLDDFEHEFAIAIQNKQFFSIDFEFNNIIFGRAKVYYTQTNFDADYTRLYNSGTSYAEMLTRLKESGGARFAPSPLSEKGLSLNELISKEGLEELKSLIEDSVRDRIAISVLSLSNSAIENLLTQLFILVLLSSADSRLILSEFIMDLLRALDYFHLLGKLSPFDTIVAKTTLCKLVRCCEDETHFELSLFEMVFTHFGSKDLVSALARLLAETLLLVFENTGLSFLSKVVFSQKNNCENLPSTEKQMLDLKHKTIGTLKSMNCFELDSKMVFGISNAVLFLFNAKRGCVLVLDDKMNMRPGPKSAELGSNLLIVNECQTNPNFVIFNSNFSEIGKQFLVSLSSASRRDENFTEGSVIRRRTTAFPRQPLGKHPRRNTKGGAGTGVEALDGGKALWGRQDGVIERQHGRFGLVGCFGSLEELESCF